MGYTTVTTARIRAAVNTPGGPVREAVRKTIRRAKVIAIADAPVGDPGDYQHRLFGFASGPKAPGTYKASFKSDIRGSRGPRVVGNLRNTADHAIYVELGRSTRGGWQRFTSATSYRSFPNVSAFEELDLVREQLIVVNGTATRAGKHILEDSLETAAAEVLGIGAARAVTRS